MAPEPVVQESAPRIGGAEVQNDEELAPRSFLYATDTRLLTPAQLLINGNLSFLYDQVEKMISIVDPNAPKILRELVPDPRHEATNTRRFLHPKDPEASLSAFDYLIYRNQALIACRMTKALNHLELAYSSIRERSNSQGSTRSGRGGSQGRRGGDSRSRSRGRPFVSDVAGFIDDQEEPTTPENALGLMVVHKVLLEKAYDDMLQINLNKVNRRQRSWKGDADIIDAKEFFFQIVEPFFQPDEFEVFVAKARDCAENDLLQEYLNLGKKWYSQNPGGRKKSKAKTPGGFGGDIIDFRDSQSGPALSNQATKRGYRKGKEPGSAKKRARILPPAGHIHSSPAPPSQLDIQESRNMRKERPIVDYAGMEIGEGGDDDRADNYEQTGDEMEEVATMDSGMEED